MAKESRTVELDGDLCRIIKRSVEREVKVDDFLSEMTKTRPIDTGLLPRGCVWFARHQDTKGVPISLYVIEIAPHVRKIIYRKRPETTKEQDTPDLCLKDYQLAWPNTIWFCRIRGSAVLDVHLSCTKEPLRARRGDTKMWVLPMPNQHGNGSGNFCIGNLNMDAKIPIDDQIEQMMEHLLASVWNQDLPPRLENVGITSIPDWAAKSEADPEIYKKLEYLGHAFGTFGNAIRHLNVPR